MSKSLVACFLTHSVDIKTKKSRYVTHITKYRKYVT